MDEIQMKRLGNVDDLFVRSSEVMCFLTHSSGVSFLKEIRERIIHFSQVVDLALLKI